MPYISSEEITREDVRRLARIFYIDIHNRTNANTKDRNEAIRLISNLPAHLRRSKLRNIITDKLGLLSEPLPSSSSVSGSSSVAASSSGGRPKACSLHKSLDRGVVGLIYQLIRAEVGHKLDGLAASQSRLSPGQRDMVRSLRGLNSLWMSKVAFEKKYLLPYSLTWCYQAGGCEACIMGRIARDREVLTNLRTVLLSRASSQTQGQRQGRRRTRAQRRESRSVPRHGSHHSTATPRLIRWVDEFMNCHGPSSLGMFVRSGEEAVHIKAVRKEIKGAASKGYQPNMGIGIGMNNGAASVSARTGTSTVFDPRGRHSREREECGGESDFEMEIIDSYANYVSRKGDRESEASGTVFSQPPDYQLNESISHHEIGSYTDVEYEEMGKSGHDGQIPSALACHLNIPTDKKDPTETKHCDAMHAYTIKGSKEYAKEYRNMLHDASKISYSPSIYSQDSMGTSSGERRVSSALTSWSMFDSEVGDASLEYIPPLRIHKKKKR